MATIFRLNTTEISTDLTDNDDEPVIGATVMATLRDDEGTDVTGAVDVAMPEQDPGTYAGELSAGLDLPDKIYFLTITGTATGGQKIVTVVNCNVKDRRS